jgi:hypothetical protein
MALLLLLRLGRGGGVTGLLLVVGAAVSDAPAAAAAAAAADDDDDEVGTAVAAPATGSAGVASAYGIRCTGEIHSHHSVLHMHPCCLLWKHEQLFRIWATDCQQHRWAAGLGAQRTVQPSWDPGSSAGAL